MFALQNFLAIAIFIADGLYNFLKISILSLQVTFHALAVLIYHLSCLPASWPASL